MALQVDDRKQTIRLQAERLKRHYDTTVRTYDDISLLDLTHSLRIWADLKHELPTLYPKFGTTLAFRSATPVNSAAKLAKPFRHVLAYMPDEVITYAVGDKPVLSSSFDKDIPFVFYSQFTTRPEGGMTFRNFAFVAGRPQVAPKQNPFKDAKISRGNFAQYMGSEIARVGIFNKHGQLACTSLTREELIRRVANTLGGSHPIAQSDSENAHRLDAPISELLIHKLGGLPIAYFLLLKTAQDIIKTAPALLEAQK